jgi:hypothetical protein
LAVPPLARISCKVKGVFTPEQLNRAGEVFVPGVRFKNKHRAKRREMKQISLYVFSPELTTRNDNFASKVFHLDSNVSNN